MLWGYMENVRTYFQPDLYVKYGQVFGSIWIATAYKGATDELNMIPSIKHHYINHISWFDVMEEKINQKILSFRGIALTGWSRYDHFLELCDLLPTAIPSLIFNLRAIQIGQINELARRQVDKELGCYPGTPWTNEEINEGQITCSFPGHEIYEVILTLPAIKRRYEENYRFAKRYATNVNLMYNYLHKARGQEALAKLQSDYESMVAFKKRFESVAHKIYHQETVNEWLTVNLIEDLDKLHSYLSKIQRALKETSWLPRPVPIKLKQYPDKMN